MLLLCHQIAFAVLYGFFCGCFISLSPAVAARLYGSGRLAGLSGLLLFFNLPGEWLMLKRPVLPLTSLASREFGRSSHWGCDLECDRRQLASGCKLFGFHAVSRSGAPTIWYDAGVCAIANIPDAPLASSI